MHEMLSSGLRRKRGVEWRESTTNSVTRTAGSSVRIQPLAGGNRLSKDVEMAQISLKVNGATRVVDTDPTTPLLYVLRNDLDQHGPRFGCGLAQCGACTVIVDGNAIRSCTVPVSTIGNKNIQTLDGLGTVEKPHPLQAAFIEEQAAQCGYCMNGILMTAKVLLDKNPNPTDADIKRALDPVLCRCGSHLRVIRAIKRAARNLQARA
jgi:nicotinate dehydrogenase subunit A